MDADEASEFLERWINAHYAAERVFSSSDQPNWWFLRNDSALTHIAVREEYEHTVIYVTSALCVNIADPVAAALRANFETSQLIFGRVFAKENPAVPGSALLMQEILPTVGMSLVAYAPSIAAFALVTGSLLSRAAAIAPALCHDLGGRPFDDDECLALALME